MTQCLNYLANTEVSHITSMSTISTSYSGISLSLSQYMSLYQSEKGYQYQQSQQKTDTPFCLPACP